MILIICILSVNSNNRKGRGNEYEYCMYKYKGWVERLSFLSEAKLRAAKRKVKRPSIFVWLPFHVDSYLIYIYIYTIGGVWGVWGRPIISSYISYFPWFKKKKEKKNDCRVIKSKKHIKQRAKIKNKNLLYFRSYVYVHTYICLYICVEAKSGDVKRER